VNDISIKCYLFRKITSKEWVASTKDLSVGSVTALEPEDAFKRIQMIILREIADRLENGIILLSDSIRVLITVEVVHENDAARLLRSDDLDF
jgi:hypothetical protein